MAFEPGERVIHIETGEHATVYRDYGEKSHVYWEDGQPAEEFGGSVIANELLRRAGGSQAVATRAQ